MSYQHGIRIEENPTTFDQPMQSLSSLQVVFGTAPINMAENVPGAVNTPIIASTFEEAKRKLGYSENWNSYTLCEAMDASLKRIKVGPVAFINVLDPAIHKKNVASASLNVKDKEAVINEEGVLLDSLVVKNDTADLTRGTDYLADFDQSGKVVISLITSTSISTLTVTYDQLDPSMITPADIVGGYDAATNQYKGIEAVSTIFPKLGLVPTILLAPGYSKEQEVGAVLAAKSENINGSFKTENVLDVEGDTIEKAIEDKGLKLFDDKSSIVCWPKVKINGKTYWYSTIMAAVMARTDAENEDVPYKSPSNKRIPVESAVNSQGKEVYLDQLQGNRLNGKGIVTAINMRGWRVWGNNTAMYDYDIHKEAVPDPKDRFVAVRRMFNWWGNNFILNYIDRVDDPTSYRLIESVVDEENIRANGFQARGQIAGARIEFRQADNPVSEILNGRIQFIQKIGFLTPAKEIVNVLEFDPTMLTESLFGGEQ
ncbi:phage tail sheath family protein [Virgibacillus halodenitrificans]|uniref:phage tail sheath family protein n=1 Tax=Virgibacillus halodenitrificans TaxID=1482 RepID=UPI000EF503F9|nr:phage tail sheath family protein [Virgibacillus halodenitrificans]